MNDGQQKESFYINPDQFPPQAPTSADIGMQQTFHHLNGPPQMHPHHIMQQHHNEFLLHAPQHNYNSQLHQPETYSVLPVGHGNFLKVYHCPENLSNLSDGSIMGGINQQYHQQQQHQSPLHMSHPQNHHAPVQIFDSYELFSSPSLMPIHIQKQQQQQTRMANDLGVQAPIVDNSKNFVEECTVQNCGTNQTTNMIINKLVNNWSPTGGAYTQFGTPLPTQASTSVDNKDFATGTPPVVPADNNINNALPINTVAPSIESVAATASTANVSNIAIATFGETHTSNSQPDTIANTAGTSSFATQEVKKRIVAEVKPMRMTYSDVLSKVNNNQGSKAQSLNSNKQFGSTTQFRENKGFPESNNTNSFRRAAAGEDHASSHARSSMKKSPTHENKENVSSNNKQGKRSTVGSPNLSNTPTNTSNVNAAVPQTQKSSNVKQGTNSNNSSKKRSTKREPTATGSDAGKTQKSMPTEKDSNAFYNVTAKRNVNSDATTKNATTNGFVNNTSARSKQNIRGSSSSSNNMNSNNTSNSNASNQSRFSRYINNGSTSNAYSYSSKRNRSGINFSASAATNRNYELAKKLFQTWLQFMLKVLTWLYYLIYDIVVLGFSMAYDRLSHAAIEMLAYMKQLYRDLKQNSNKPGVWIKTAWRRFDARFKKNSKFAFWRYFYKKKPPEPATESFKQGRLPQTGEEAMYSLLNCKGKDAYSILGVPPDSSQEQIRKHYKKIAVLVHPDKNKQAGSEEAFKVLQRAFELIGEPDKRLAYDQSLAEALHAEKAWSELHDLLSQLQTKITEAASTIRCSTCGLRHPRRLVDRPPYAARECATCKIRHPAREGDIWAETSFMGLRWKYLALMEGKVYDISEWANCQKGALAHLEPNSHLVQYRIVRGAQQQQQQQQQQQHQQQSQQQPHPHSPHHQFGNGMFKHDFPSSEASLHDFLDNLYSGQNPNNASSSAYSGSSRRRNRRN